MEGETVVARQLLATLAKKQSIVNSVNSGVSVEAKNTKGKEAAHEVMEKDGENNKLVSSCNSELIENNYGNSPADDSNPPTASTVVPGNPSDDSVQPESSTPLEFIPHRTGRTYHRFIPYHTAPDAHTTAKELTVTSLSGTPWNQETPHWIHTHRTGPTYHSNRNECHLAE